jgi:cell division control protein 45
VSSAARLTLDSKNVKLLQQGIQHAIELQQAIVRQVTTIIEKKDIVQSGPFRYCLLNESPELKYFVHPLALSKLAHFLLDTLIVRTARCAPH